MRGLGVRAGRTVAAVVVAQRDEPRFVEALQDLGDPAVLCRIVIRELVLGHSPSRDFSSHGGDHAREDIPDRDRVGRIFGYELGSNGVCALDERSSNAAHLDIVVFVQRAIADPALPARPAAVIQFAQRERQQRQRRGHERDVIEELLDEA